MIGVVGRTTAGDTSADGIDAGGIVDGIEAVGGSASRGDAADVLATGPDAVVAVGGSGVIDLARDVGDVPVPVLAVGGGAATRHPDVVERDVEHAVGALASGRFETVEHPVLGVDVGTERVGRAAFDAMVVTSDPGDISEYRIVAGADLGSVRADGVVVATPAGSHGYARSAGGPRVVADASLAAVVPIAAFTMTPERWVVDLDPPIEITSERDVDVSLALDDGQREIGAETTVSVGLAGTLPLVVPEGAGPE